MVTIHTLIPIPVSIRHRDPCCSVPRAAAGAPSTAVDPPESLTAAHGSRDAVALEWDLTVYRLHQAFAECLAGSPDATDGGSRPLAASMFPTGTGLAGVRLAATGHAVNDIQDALRRMAAGNYGTRERCGQPITTVRLQTAPTTPVVFDLPGAGWRVAAARRCRDPARRRHRR
jgi:hypothetical protein